MQLSDVTFAGLDSDGLVPPTALQSGPAPTRVRKLGQTWVAIVVAALAVGAAGVTIGAYLGPPAAPAPTDRRPALRRRASGGHPMSTPPHGVPAGRRLASRRPGGSRRADGPSARRGATRRARRLVRRPIRPQEADARTSEAISPRARRQ